MSGLILPPGFNKRTTPPKPKITGSGNLTVKKQPETLGVIGHMEHRAQFWCDYEYPGDVAAAIVNALRDGRKPPVPEPKACPNRDCRVCHPSQEDLDRLARGHHPK